MIPLFLLSAVKSKFALPVAAALLMGGIIMWVYSHGVDSGKREIIAEVEKSRAASVSEKEEIDDEIRSLDEDALLERALGAVRP